jgi:exodeoxyribonuclease X
VSGHAIVIDTETTGIDEPDVISLAVAGPFESPTNLSGSMSLQKFKPSKPITLGAMATHHIIDEDLVDCEPWPGHWSAPEGVEYLIAHNCDFDWKAVGSPDVKRICTLALSRHLWPEVDSHSLGAMTYYLQGRAKARELLRRAHSADQDVYLCSLLLDEILKCIPGTMSWDQLWQTSEKARVPVFLSFGKYGPHEAWAKAHGGPMKCADVRRQDPGYFSWLMNKCDQVRDDPYLRKALGGAA